MQILASLKNFLSQFSFPDDPPDFMVGVSGGSDSMVLLWALTELAPQFNYQLFVLHFNYRLHRRADEAYQVVRSWTEKRGVPLIDTVLWNPEAVKDSSGSLEDEARKIRYDFFSTAGRILGTEKLFLAHQRDDQVETVLLNLGRGCGVFGLQGMRAVNERDNLEILRPFLDISAREIRQTVREREIPFVEDPTNKDPGYARNRLRHEILPAWQKAQPDPVKAIYKLSRRVRKENDFWETYLEDNFQFWCWKKEIQVAVSDFLSQPEAARLRLLHYLFKKLAGKQLLSEQNLIDLVSLFSANNSGKIIHMPEGFRGCREYDRVALYKKMRESEEKVDIMDNIPGSINWPGGGKIKLDYSAPVSKEIFASRLEEELLKGSILRTWKPGDRLLQGGRSRKLKEIFQAEKIPYRARRSWPLVVNDKKILAAVGLAVNDGYTTQNAVIIKFRPQHPKFAQITTPGG